MHRLILLPVIAFMVMVGFRVNEVSAAPAGAATSQAVIQQTCQSDGTVRARFSWSPSGLGNQWVDVSVFNNGFTSSWGNSGPLGPSVNSYDWFGLAPNTVYYTRVNTFANGAWLPSDTISFGTVSCFTVPTNLSTTALSDGNTRFHWDRGLDNHFFCVDTAFTSSDLLNFEGSWHNWGCGTTGTSVDAELLCGTPHFWRVWAAGTGVSGHSAVVEFTTADCNFSNPSNPESTTLSASSIRFEWDAGESNRFFCLDLAESEEDLTDLTGTWANYGCGVTETMLAVNGLDCDTTYYWRVWAFGSPTQSGYTPIATATTAADCGFTAPTNLSSTVLSPTSVNTSWAGGADNQSFCVDTAESQADLLSFSGSWASNGCGTTETELDITGLECDTTYYWRVYAQGTNVAGYSVVRQFTTSACP